MMLRFLAASTGCIMHTGAIHRDQKHRKTTFQIEMRGSHVSYPIFSMSDNKRARTDLIYWGELSYNQEA